MSEQLEIGKNLKKTINQWWLFVLFGVFMIIGGGWVLKTPEESYLALSLLLSAMVLVNGFVDSAFAIANRNIIDGWGWYLTGGILEIALGFLLMNHPGITMNILPLLLGFWLLFGAVSMISSSLDLKRFHIKSWGWLMFLGVLLLVLGFMIMAKPMLGLKSIVFITGFGIIMYGLSYIMLGMHLKKVKSVAEDVSVFVKNEVDDIQKKVLEIINDTDLDDEVKNDLKSKIKTFRNKYKE